MYIVASTFFEDSEQKAGNEYLGKNIESNLALGLIKYVESEPTPEPEQPIVEPKKKNTKKNHEITDNSDI